MTLESQVVSLENAKKLKEIELEQKSLFYWCDDCVATEYQDDYIFFDYYGKTEIVIYGCGCCSGNAEIKEIYAAFTAQELLDKCKDILFYMGFNDGKLFVNYCSDHGTDNSYKFEGNNLADLLAQMLIAKNVEDNLPK